MFVNIDYYLIIIKLVVKNVKIVYNLKNENVVGVFKKI